MPKRIREREREQYKRTQGNGREEKKSSISSALQQHKTTYFEQMEEEVCPEERAK